MNRQNSLTAPTDKTEQLTKMDVVPPLNDDQTQAGVKELLVPLCPKVERKYVDPPIPGQVFCLHSFVPANGATPDKDGIYGMIKCRGVFNNLDEATQHGTEIIKTVDSLHKIHVSKVGYPFPMSLEEKFSAEKKSIDIKEKTEEVINTEINEQKSKDKQVIKEIKEREQKLLDDVKTEESPLDRYIMTRVKRAQLIWTVHENAKKIQELVDYIHKADDLINTMDSQYPKFKTKYMKRYNKARADAGFDPQSSENFSKYMDLADVKLPTVMWD